MKKILIVLTLIATPALVGYTQIQPAQEPTADAWEGMTPDQIWFAKNF